MMNPVLNTIEAKIKQGEVTREEVKECAEAVMELREQHPEAWSICSLADDDILERFTE
jgi:wobble nucleotide-excising tRNase